MNEYYREQAERLLDSIDGLFVGGIAEARGVPVDTVRKVIATAPSRPEVLEALKLIDGVRTRAALIDELGEGHARRGGRLRGGRRGVARLRPARHLRADLRQRHDPERTRTRCRAPASRSSRPRSAIEALAGCRRGRRDPRDRAAHRQPRRRRLPVRADLAGDPPGAQEEADRRVVLGLRRVGRLLPGVGDRRDRRAARHAHRLDRRLRGATLARTACSSASASTSPRSTARPTPRST